MSSGSLLIKNGKIIGARGAFDGHILVKDGKIAALFGGALSCGEEAAEVLDAGGRYIIPGAVDAHTHMNDPGHTEREDFITGTRAAAYGGVTTVVDHHRSDPPVYSVREHEAKVDWLKDRAVVDFALMGGASPDNADKLEAMWQAGVIAFKTFTCNLHGVRAMYPGLLFNALQEIARFGGIALIHAEDDSIMAENEKRLKAAGRTDYLSQLEWRSALAEKVAVQTVITLAKATGARVVVAHVSQPELLQAIKEARDEGYPIYAESCPHYFYLTDQDLKKKGPWAKFTPPMKTATDVASMWELFNRGYVTTIGSDHCPFPQEVKAPGEQNIWEAPNGIPGVETSLRLMLNAVNNGKTTLERVVETMCAGPARLYGLYPRKGAIEVGCDADLVIVDMEREETLSNDAIVSKCGWTPFDGLTIKGVPRTVLVRGQYVVKDGRIVGQPGMGQFVPRQD